MIQIENLKSGYGNKKILDIEKLSFERGKITSVTGVNGSGKSTLLKTVIGMLKYEGKIVIDGYDLKNLSVKLRARLVSYLPQNQNISSLDVFTLACHGRFSHLGFSKVLSEKDYKIVENALKLTDMWEKRNLLLKSISGGERQRAFLSMVISQDAKMIFLDEVQTYMDINHQIEIMKVLRFLADSGIGIVFTSHDLPQSFSFSDKVCIMENGKIIIQGKPDEVALQSGILKSHFGVTLKKIEDKNSLYRWNLSF